MSSQLAFDRLTLFSFGAELYSKLDLPGSGKEDYCFRKALLSFLSDCYCAQEWKESELFLMHLFTNIAEPAELSTGSTDTQRWPSTYPIFRQKLPKTVCLKDVSEGPRVKMNFASVLPFHWYYISLSHGNPERLQFTLSNEGLYCDYKCNVFNGSQSGMILHSVIPSHGTLVMSGNIFWLSQNVLGELAEVPLVSSK